ncbi:histidine kinase [Desulfocapsa sulfexigens DSM 10523]|uniref:histidine kinase n=1 Tax=Desulfocapsa sulfexigens (strain DSM 10523 / SB164P1) TaxID=1167006 RepID=M1PII1_DESSD|nr:transporter substrate-binding domain-containing protein [Desulfocapsa sulfexigens]AGF79405.1 histidine kinase [Desulfocapsa sulfexigens DSM 10523]
MLHLSVLSNKNTSPHAKVVWPIRFLSIFFILWWIVVATAFADSLGTTQENQGFSVAVNLTEHERAWLDRHPVIRIGVDAEFPPYEFINQYNQHSGISSDYLKELSKILGIRFEMALGLSWSEILNQAKEKKIDLLPLVTASPKRSEYLTFTAPYVRYQIAIISREGLPPTQTLSDLTGKKVALVENYISTKQVLENNPAIQPYFVKNVMEGLKSVVDGTTTAMISDTGTTAYILKEFSLPSLHISGFIDIPVQAFSIGVRDDWPELTSILNKALQSIPDHQKQQIVRRWLEPAPDDNIVIMLTQQEKLFIQQHPVIRLGIDPEFAPFEFMENGIYSGMTSDFIQILNKRLGLNMQVVKGLSWTEAIEGVKKDSIDILPCVGITDERKAFLNFTKPYINFHRVIITRNDMPFISSLHDIRSLRVAVQTNTSHAGYLKEYTSIAPVQFPTLRESLLALNNGEVEAFIGNVASATYWIRKMNLSNLKVAAPVSQELQSLHFAVRSDWPELVGILQKGLDSISDKQRRLISEKWLILEYDPIKDYALIIKISLGFLVLLIVVGLWNVQIRRQKKEIQVAQKEALAANAELTRIQEELEELVAIRTSELQKSEKNFRQAQKMEALGTLVGGIAHDFNNMLAGILGSVFLAQHSCKNPEELNKSLTLISDLGCRAADMIKQLLAFSRQETVLKSSLPLTPFFKEAIKLIRIGVEENINFNYHVCNDKISVYANSTQLQQLLFNLVNNAKDAVADVKNPKISVSLSSFESNEDFFAKHQNLRISSDRFAVLEVQDNGEGIPPENLEQLFDPFFTTKAVDKGTGLGLAMVYGTVRDHGGVVEVDSTVGKGSCFRVYLPLEEAPAVQMDKESYELFPGKGETILLVEDNLQLQSTNKAILTKLGYLVKIANDGKEALDLFVTNHDHIDLVIMDVVMPNMSGLEAAKKMRQFNRDVKVIYFTGYDSKGPLTKHMKQVHGVVLNKPCPINHLSRTIREQLA